MYLLPLSFLAGILTVLAPCSFSILPVIIGGSLTEKEPYRPFFVTASLGLSIMLFTLLLKSSALFIRIPSSFWQIVSGVIIIFFALMFIFPGLWTVISEKIGFHKKANENLSAAAKKQGLLGAVLLGFALGPVFTSCSPTYSFILGVILPVQFTVGILNLIFYSLGLFAVMFSVALLGQKAVVKLKWLANPQSVFRKIIGVIFLLTAIVIMFSLDKVFAAWLFDNNFFDITRIESIFLNSVRQ